MDRKKSYFNKNSFTCLNSKKYLRGKTFMFDYTRLYTMPLVLMLRRVRYCTEKYYKSLPRFKTKIRNNGYAVGSYRADYEYYNSAVHFATDARARHILRLCVTFLIEFCEFVGILEIRDFFFFPLLPTLSFKHFKQRSL